MPSSENGTTKVSIKQEDSSDRIQQLEEETQLLKKQLARQEILLNQIRDESIAKANNRATICWIILFLIVFLVVSVVWMGYPSMLSRDTTLHLNVKATPVKAPFITAGVRVRFTMGDLASCVKGAFSGDTIDLSLS